MKRRTAAQVLADATSSLVQTHDVTDSLARLLGDCAEVLSAAAVGLLVWSDRGEIELLSSTSHAIAELELFQIQQATGPCIDAISSDSEISVVGSAQIMAHWPGVGRTITEAGYRAVHASPLRWHGQNLGAMNVFFTEPQTLTKEQSLVAQAFADVATLVVMQPAELSDLEVGERTRSALAGRTVVEQAKGVIAQQRGVDMPSAYDLLMGMATEHQASLSVVAEDFVRMAQQGSLPD
jgi:GAF domain-containing protein